VPLFLLLAACASEPTEPQGKYHSANSINDLFPIEQGMPIREVKSQKFFPKKCDVTGRRPYFTKTEYGCTDQ